MRHTIPFCIYALIYIMVPAEKNVHNKNAFNPTKFALLSIKLNEQHYILTRPVSIVFCVCVLVCYLPQTIEHATANTRVLDLKRSTRHM